jgi:hypothetical protein
MSRGPIRLRRLGKAHGFVVRPKAALRRRPRMNGSPCTLLRVVVQLLRTTARRDVTRQQARRTMESALDPEVPGHVGLQRQDRGAGSKRSLRGVRTRVSPPIEVGTVPVRPNVSVRSGSHRGIRQICHAALYMAENQLTARTIFRILSTVTSDKVHGRQARLQQC